MRYTIYISRLACNGKAFPQIFAGLGYFPQLFRDFCLGVQCRYRARRKDSRSSMTLVFHTSRPSINRLPARPF